MTAATSTSSPKRPDATQASRPGQIGRSMTTASLGGRLEYMAQANPFQDPLRFERRVPSCALVIFGANGDLTKRKLLPSLYRLAFERRLPQGFAVIGISRTAMSDDDFRAKMEISVKEFLENSPFDQALWDDFARGLFYISGDVGDDGLFQRLAVRLDEIGKARQTGAFSFSVTEKT